MKFRILFAFVFLSIVTCCSDETVDVKSNLIDKKWIHIKSKSQLTSGFEYSYYKAVYKFNEDGTGVVKQAITNRVTFAQDTINTQITWVLDNRIIHLSGGTPELFLNYNGDWKVVQMEEKKLMILSIYPNSDYVSYSVFLGE